jgi:hypothetical protein
MTWGMHHALGNGIIFCVLCLYVKSLYLKFKSNKMIGKKINKNLKVIKCIIMIKYKFTSNPSKETKIANLYVRDN